MRLLPLVKKDGALRVSPVAPIALIQWNLVPSTVTLEMVFRVREVGKQTFVVDVYGSNEREESEDVSRNRDPY